MEQTTTLNKLKEQAEINALKRLQSQFSSLDQLEQIEQHISRNEKAKNMIENQLKSAIQSHFISVSSCMDQLKDINKNIVEVKNTIYSIQEEYKTISHLENTLGELRKEATKHKQLKSAKENVQNILNVHDLSKQANQYIEENKLLLAHKCLFDMEKCRNDILEELGNPSDTNHNIDDIKLVLEFFKKVKELQGILHNNIFLTVKRMLEASKSCPEQLVTALRIIYREEALDEFWMKKKEETRFAPPDRPKRWREECRKAIREMIETKVHGCRIEESGTDKSWLGKHLGNIGTRLVADLDIVKQLCEPCFPPSFKLLDFFVESIHQTISAYFNDLIDNNVLKDYEFFVLISWNNNFKSVDFVGNPRLKYDVNKLPDLLDDVHFKKALDGHLEYDQRRFNKLFSKTIDKNFGEWMNNVEPLNIEGYYESNLPNDINPILVENLNLIAEAKDERFSREYLKNLVSLLNGFVETLKGKVIDFKSDYSKESPTTIEYIKRMIANSNDCFRLKIYFLNIRSKYDTFMDKDEEGGPNDIYESLGAKVMGVSDICLESILEDMARYLDEKFFKILLSREWLGNSSIIGTIINTSKDYMSDLRYLRPEPQLKILIKWHNRIKVEYMKGFFQNLSMMTKVFRKCQFSDPGERKAFSSQVSKEIITLEGWFENMASTLPNHENAFDFDALKLMNAIMTAEDIEFLGMDVHSLVKKCPNLTSEMLFALLSLRGDISKSDFKEKFEDSIKPESTPNAKNPKSPGSKAVKEDEAFIILKRELKIQ